MDKIGLGYDFERLTPDIFRDFLRDLQEEGPYRWPNLYFAWEKNDGSLLMVGTNSSQMWHMIVRECDPEYFQNKVRIRFGEALEYSSILYGICPGVGYYESGNKRYDPVEKLVQKVADCKYLGHWMDPDILMDDWRGFNKVLACGRWELAKEKIGVSDKQPALDLRKGLDEQIRNAENQTRDPAVVSTGKEIGPER